MLRALSVHSAPMPSPGMRVTRVLPSGVLCMVNRLLSPEATGVVSGWKPGFNGAGGMTVVLGTNPPRHKGGGTMTMMVLDPAEQRRLKRERALTGADRFDEVWDGV